MAGIAKIAIKAINKANISIKIAAIAIEIAKIAVKATNKARIAIKIAAIATKIA
jgi:hypothetical protein